MTQFDDDLLLRGERMLWQGAPLRHPLFRPQDVLLIPFSILWLAGAVFAAASVLVDRTAGDRPPPVFFALFGAAFVLVGLYFAVGRFVVRAVAFRRTRYMLTDLRIVVIGGVTGSRATAEYLRSLPPPVVAARPDGSGSLAFGAFPGVLDRSGLEEWGSESSGNPVLWHIAEVRRVRDLIAGVQMEPARTTFHGHQG